LKVFATVDDSRRMAEISPETRPFAGTHGATGRWFPWFVKFEAGRIRV